MKKVFFTLILAAFVFGFSGIVFADDDGRYVRERAAQENIKLITVEQAKQIALQKLNAGSNVYFKDIDLDDEADDYPNATYFRPVYQMEVIAGHVEYDIDIDAVTGQVLKFKIDD
ncbi:MAG: PepSY domain-containing protein [Synergistaceae bacterium]|nr:PepSY domain-containing protein [Synergistaceae bacterium]MBQ6434381.1 PepSY domain-containing protein [Synergistaceae bacterium]MBQ6737586.1 PepSY domain-containing protein [Synergistaceae bacterium]MBQ7068234.1 PepSY domain-containing protein [Synergistaceae bacterium]MBR0075160.1 PepSY domain-containing protein [Synergistaceae bacterium]